jgi:hypothetical protein
VYWPLIGVVLVFGGIWAFVATLYFASDLRRSVDEAVRSLPPEDIGHAIDVLNEEESP